MNEIFIDVVSGSVDSIVATEKDNLNETYKFILIKNKLRVDLTNKNVKMIIINNNSKFSTVLDLPIIDAKNGELEFKITDKITFVSGTFNCQIGIISENGFLENTGHLTIYIKNSLFVEFTELITNEWNFGDISKIIDDAEKFGNDFPNWEKFFNQVRIDEAGRLSAEKRRDEKIEKFSSQVTEIANDFDEAVANVTNGNENATNSEIVQARGGEVNLNKRLDKFDSQLSDIETKQDWYNVFEKNKVKNDSRLLLKKIDDKNMYIYIHHFDNLYQRWQLTRNIGLDDSVPDPVNGNPWQVNQVTLSKILIKDDIININDSTVIKEGNWAIYGSTVVSSSIGDTLKFSVNCKNLWLNGVFKPDGGIAELFVDGKKYNDIDFYNNEESSKSIKIAENLTEGNHDIVIKVKGKNDSSSGNNIRITSVTGVKYNIFANLSDLIESSITMPSGRHFRLGGSAIEVAIRTWRAGNDIWSGTWHKYLNPTSIKIFIDGTENNLINNNTFYELKDLIIIQECKIINGIDIADFVLTEHFTHDGYHVKWKLKWLEKVGVVMSYNSMFGTSVDRLKFGDSQEVWKASKDGQEKGNKKTFNAIGWQSEDNYAIAYKALNPVAMQYTGVDKYMYFLDRASDMKLYVPRFKGDSVVGDEWISEFIVSIGKIVTEDVLN